MWDNLFVYCVYVSVLPHLPKHLLTGLIKCRIVNSQAGKDRQVFQVEGETWGKDQRDRDLPARHGGSWALVTKERRQAMCQNVD